jgi:hypothetical protein
MAQRAFLGQLKELQDKIERVQPTVLTKAARKIVDLSPDDTGAYILSHSIGRSGNVGGSISSHGRPQAPNTHGPEAYDNLLSQIAGIPPNSTRVWIGNNSPHVNAVEFGGANWNKPGYQVYTTFYAVFPGIIQEAVREAGLK